MWNMRVAVSGPVAKITVRKQMGDNEVQLEDHESLWLKPRAPSKSVDVSTFFSIGSTESSGSELEFERRLVSSTNEQVFQ